MDLLLEAFLFLLSYAALVYILGLLKPNPGPEKSAKLPPGPNPLPVIGNILELGQHPHRSLAKLSEIYGPLMHLRLGKLTTIVVSSPEIAKIVLQKHDQVFSNRPCPNSVQAVDHQKFSMVWLPVDNGWRKLRRICKEQMFSVPRLDSSQGLRMEKLQKLRDYVKGFREAGRAVDVGEAVFTTSLNLMSATLFSLEFAPQFGSGSSQEMQDVVWGVMKCVGSPNLADYFPILKRADPQGIMRDAKFYFGRLFDIFDEIIDKKLEKRKRGELKPDDLVEALIDINLRDENELSRDEIKHLLLDLFVAGIDTTSGTVEWAMTELLRNPAKMARVRGEIIDVMGTIGQVQESDISKLPYLQAVVKETFRLHPAAPFLVPHKSATDIEINGYIIPKNAQILVNVWASGRDPNVWSDAGSFMPERFLNHNDRQIDFKGKDFELIPFGAGRRICPGLPLANRMVHLMLATLVHNFGWKLEEGMEPEVDMDEKFGLTLQKAIPLKAIPTNL